MTERVFRRLNVSDLPIVLRMNQDFRENFICEESTRLFLAQPQNWLFACIENRRVVGFIYGYECNRLDDAGNMLYIHEVGVLPENHRQGIGRQMLSDIKTLCRLSGICRLFLTTSRTNEAACGLYHSQGGEICNDAEMRFFFNDLN